ncbi:MAG: hypothetical protein ACLQSR_03870 [Limisphaerales bacterium]
MNKTLIIKEAAEKALAAENERTKELNGSGEKFTAGIIIVAGFQLLNVPNLLESPSSSGKVLCFLAMAILSLSLFFGFCSMQIKKHAGYPREDKLWENLKPESVADEAAAQALIQLLLKNRERNAKLNDRKAGLLFWCRWLFFAGFLLAASSQLLAALANLSND